MCLCDEHRPGPQAGSRLSVLEVQQEAQVVVTVADSPRAGGVSGIIPGIKPPLTRILFIRALRSTFLHGYLHPVLQVRSGGHGGVLGLAQRSAALSSRARGKSPVSVCPAGPLF